MQGNYSFEHCFAFL